MDTNHSLFRKEEPAVPVRGIHLDLKGLPPPFSELLKLVELFAALRFNTLLVEWEDTFPWMCDPAFRGATYYTPEEIVEFSKTCKNLGIEIIPLVQSLGHAENVLGARKDESLRELPWRTDVLNPLNPQSADLIRQMIDDVVALLPDVRRFHLGGDEVQILGSNELSKAYIEKHGLARLYMQQFEPLIEHLETLEIRPLFWHDEFVQWPVDELEKLVSRIDLVVWGYSGDPRNSDTYHHRLPHVEKLKGVGFDLWGATAYKGADGAGSDYPDPLKRQPATQGWAEMQKEWELKGIFATGWSRYTTARIQTEPIEGALDSLVNTAVILHDGKPPEGGLAECETWLNLYGRGESFRSCRAAMLKLSYHRNRAWDYIRSLEEQIANVVVDDSRKGSSIEQVLFDVLYESIRGLEEAEQEGRIALHGLVEECWLEDYYKVRRYSIETAARNMEKRLREKGLSLQGEFQPQRMS